MKDMISLGFISLCLLALGCMRASQAEAHPRGAPGRAAAAAVETTAPASLSAEDTIPVSAVGGAFTVDLGRVRWVSQVDVTWYHNNPELDNPRPFEFEIAFSRDGVSYTRVFAETCSGTSIGPETYDTADAAVRYIRITPARRLSRPVGITALAVKGNATPVRDLWVWNSFVVTDPAERAAFLDYAVSHAVGTLYLHSETLIAEQPAALADFCRVAAEHGLAVELLFAKTSWTLTVNHAQAVGVARQAVAFALDQPFDVRPVGLHFDVEPHTLREWKDGDEINTAEQYVVLLEKLAQVTAGTGLRLTVDIPFWFDGRKLTRNGVTRSLHEWILDRVDSIVLMDYRDYSLRDEDGATDGTISLAETEVAYANSIGKKVSLGLETKCDLTPTKVTFCEEGKAVLERVLEETRAHFKDNPGFARMAIHHYKTWRALKP